MKASYAAAIETVGRASNSAGTGSRVTASRWKLSALSPRYEATQEARVWSELYPRIKRLAVLAAKPRHQLHHRRRGSRRLVISLKLLDKLAREPDLGAWTGLGLAVQAYQKRAPEVIGPGGRPRQKSSGRRLMVRLVKGAYWDTRSSAPRSAGRPDYPVYTTKPGTDLSYLVCRQGADRRRAAPLRPVRHPQRPHPGGRPSHGQDAKSVKIEHFSACTAWERHSLRPPPTISMTANRAAGLRASGRP